MTDSPPSENLQFLSDVIVTANQSFIRFHGRNTKGHYWYNYLYSEQELKPWVEKVNQIRKQTKVLRIYFNNHYGWKAVVNAMQFEEMIGVSLSADEKKYWRIQKRTSLVISAELKQGNNNNLSMKQEIQCPRCLKYEKLFLLQI
jgi:uncharacterized protein YecE (DUF72 family)